MSEIDFDPQSYQPVTSGFDPLPAGDYVVSIKKHEKKQINKTDPSKGDCLSLQLTVLEGDHKGRTLFDRLNLWSTAPRKEEGKLTAAEFARSQFRVLTDACNVPRPKNVAELYGIPVVAKVALKSKYSNKDEMENEIKGYSKRSRDPAPKSPASNAAPWAKTQAA